MPPTSRPIVTMSTLGRNGRFGNQIFQYAFARLYAQQHDLELRLPKWVGNELFGHDHAEIGDLSLPVFYDSFANDTTLNRLVQPVVNVDLWGYFQYPTVYYRPAKARFQALFEPVAGLKMRLNRSLQQLRSDGRTVIAIHIRRGDFVRNAMTTPTQFYLEWLQSIWPSHGAPRLYIATDDKLAVVPEFHAFSPMTDVDLGNPCPSAPYYVDHFVLSNADVVAISNSTFSFTATMLNTRATAFLRPFASRGGLASFDPWNSHPTAAEPETKDPFAYYADLQRRAEAAVLRLATEGGDDASRAVRECRVEIVDIWLSADDDTLILLHDTAIWDAHRLLATSPARNVPSSMAESSVVAALLDDLRTPDPLWRTQRLLVAMLYMQGRDLPVTHDFARIPQWLRPAYAAWLRQ